MNLACFLILSAIFESSAFHHHLGVLSRLGFVGVMISLVQSEMVFSKSSTSLSRSWWDSVAGRESERVWSLMLASLIHLSFLPSLREGRRLGVPGGLRRSTAGGWMLMEIG